MSGPTHEERERSFRRVRRYYSEYQEWERLERTADGALEFTVNKAWLTRYLPAAGSSVLDIGGGPGRYAIWLADKGYGVTLADLSSRQLEVASEKAAEAGVTLEAVVEANATAMPEFTDASFDAVLCMGPMYHLISEEDRRNAAAEVARVARSGAPVFVAFLNRLPLPRGMLGAEMPQIPADMQGLVDRWFETGVFVSPVRGFFTDSYYAHPGEIAPLMEHAGLDMLELIASESLVGGAEERLASIDLHQPHLGNWVEERLIEIAREPSVIGSSWHLLYIGRKP